MTKETHTPGPWTIEQPATRQQNAVIRDKEGQVVAMVGVQEDAVLIAAAPDLLAACERQFAYLAQFSVAMDDEERSMAKKIRAAIAKAKGGAA